ncbi:MAG: hypothetical protein M5U19_14905 [Microthrixaceae bacterium]|nr:hypothetical protein [Microthrixaceae bacterium]
MWHWRTIAVWRALHGLRCWSTWAEKTASMPRGLRRLVTSINRYLGEHSDGADSVDETLVGDGLSVLESRPVGTAWLLDGLWSQLGVDTAFGEVLGRRRFSTDVERVSFAMVANRAIAPRSSLVPSGPATTWRSPVSTR